MQNNEAVQAWFQGKMVSFRILGLVSKNEIRSREFLFTSRSLRVKIINLDLVSLPEIGGNFLLGLVSKPENKCQEFSVSSRWTRLNRRNSHSRLEIEKTTLADHWWEGRGSCGGSGGWWGWGRWGGWGCWRDWCGIYISIYTYFAKWLEHRGKTLYCFMGHAILLYGAAEQNDGVDGWMGD